MGYTLDKDGIKDIKYCDYVDITDVYDYVYIYNVFYSDENGIRLSTGNDEPQIILKEEKRMSKKTCAEVGDDLPF